MSLETGPLKWGGHNLWVGGYDREGGNEGGDERDVGGGARRAEATGEG